MLEMKLRKNYSVTSFAEKEIRKLCNSFDTEIEKYAKIKTFGRTL
jgi:hypothetical protein